jgi:hypothetical protein
MPENSIFNMIDGLEGNGFNDFDRRFYAHEAAALKAALRQVPEALWGGEWDGEDLKAVVSEIREIFMELGNADVLERLMAGMTRRIGKAELSEIARCQSAFVRQFHALAGNSQVYLRRTSFVKVIFTMIITCRRYPPLTILNGGRSKHRRVSEMELARLRRGFQSVLPS